MGMMIGICGEAGSGKDSVANYLEEHHGFKVIKFAGPLKDIVAKVFNLDRERLDDDLDYKEKHIVRKTPYTPREILQHIGTEGFRHIDDMVWIRMAMKKADEHSHAGHTNVVFADLRFPNEANAIWCLNGSVWKTIKTDGSGTTHRGHASEAGVSAIKADHELTAAHGELPLLFGQVEALIAAGQVE